MLNKFPTQYSTVSMPHLPKWEGRRILWCSWIPRERTHYLSHFSGARLECGGNFDSV